MPIVRSPQYVCDYCKRPFGPAEEAVKALYQVWKAGEDPRNRRDISDPESPLTPRQRRDYVRGKRPDGKWAPDLNVPSQRFPVPPRARWWDIALHEACAAWFLLRAVAEREAELADAG